MKSAVASHYAHLAECYGSGAFYQNRRSAVTAAIAPELQRAQTILDLGSANGLFTMGFATQASHARLIAADLSFQMLQVAQKRLSGRSVVLQANAEHLPFRDASLELVFCTHVLYFVSDIEPCVREITRILKPGGILVTNINLLGPYTALSDLLRKERTVGSWFNRAILAILTRAVPLLVRRRMLRLPKTNHRVAASCEQQYRAAFEHAGLVATRMDVAFTTTRTGMVESAQERWLAWWGTCLQSLVGQIMKRLLIGTHGSDAVITLHEPLLIGRKPI